MGYLQTQNLTQGPVQPEVAHWEATAHPSATGQLAVNDLIVVLGVLTFGLQLCLVLFFVSRCLRFDSKMRDALKELKTASGGAALSSPHGGICKQASYQQRNTDSSSSLIVPLASAQHLNSSPLFAPSIPWDLVQG